ncbi:MAG TPA: phage baseplate assembly protein V [Longimicrobiales bacterium]|nr:phage baseplate assembly protein V [Longimicrobiales bacterium]
MTDLVSTIRSLIRHELAGARHPELGIVTEVFSHDSDSSDGNHQVNVRLQASALELHRVPVAVARIGLSALPDVGHLVVVAFVGGDLNAPVVLGSLYDADAHPPVAEAREIVYQPQDAEDDSVRRLHLEWPNGTTLTMDDSALEIVAGGTTVKINRDGDVAIAAKGGVTYESDGDIEIKAAGNLKLSAQGNVEVKGTGTATLEGSGSATVKGPSLTLAGNTQFSPS